MLLEGFLWVCRVPLGKCADFGELWMDVGAVLVELCEEVVLPEALSAQPSVGYRGDDAVMLGVGEIWNGVPEKDMVEGGCRK